MVVPPPNIMDPALRAGLFNPNAYVRGSAVEAVGKIRTAMAIKKAEEVMSNARGFVKRLEPVEANVPDLPANLTNEELAAFKELIDEEQLEMEEGEEEQITANGKGGEGRPANLEDGGEKPAEKQQKKKVRYHCTIKPFKNDC